jgi:phosphoglycerate dehydrogenase-like enzyme
MDLLISERATKRIGARLEELSNRHRLYFLGDDGKVRLSGTEVADGGFNPEVTWLSGDVMQQRLIDRYFDLVDAHDSVKWLQTLHAGLDHPRYPAVFAKGIRVSNSNAQAPAIAEYIIGNVLAIFQPLAEQQALQAAGQWKALRFREIAGSRWLIIGLGNIGLETARRAKAFGAHVTGVRRSAFSDAALDQMVTPADMAAHLPAADVVVLSCPLTTATENLVDAGFIAAMKTGSTLVNIGRGGLIDDAALLSGLERDQPGHAVLDVFRSEPLPTQDPYWGHEKVRLTAHSSNAGSGTVGRGDELFLGNLERYEAGEKLINEVSEL